MNIYKGFNKNSIKISYKFDVYSLYDLNYVYDRIAYNVDALETEIFYVREINYYDF